MICPSCDFWSDEGIRCAKCGVEYCFVCHGIHGCESEVSLWPHQKRGLDEMWALIDAGEKAICVTSPTGGGKTFLMRTATLQALARGWKVALYTHRKLLTVQTSGVFAKGGISHGVMAAGHKPAFLRDVQIASFQTITSRVYYTQRWKLHEAELVFVDEAHANGHPTAARIIRDHMKAGAVVVGFTATPVGIGHIYKQLVVAGTNSELRACGAHVPCEVFGPDEPDLTRMKRDKYGEFSQEQVVKRIMVSAEGDTRPRIFGRVLDNYRKLNPDRKPTILFAPGVKESLWFVDQFKKEGIVAAHIDAQTPDDERQAIIEGSKTGSVEIITNRFVMREGVDLPWLEHCILATAFGAPSNWLQAVGRLLRSYPGLDKVRLQDHGAHWHRPGFGSPNADRIWDLADTNLSIIKKAKKKNEYKEDAEPEPICCPECGGIRRSGPKCPYCGHEHKRSTRYVIQTDGTLKKLFGDVYKKKERCWEEQKIWSSCYFSALNAGGEQTMEQVAAWFRKRTGHNAPMGMMHMPGPGEPQWKLTVRDYEQFERKRYRKHE